MHDSIVRLRKSRMFTLMIARSRFEVLMLIVMSRGDEIE